METFTPRRFDRRVACDDCGANADEVLVADRVEPETGYQYTIALCRQCAAKREREYSR